MPLAFPSVLIISCHNLNPGKSQHLKALCKPLDDYSKFSNKFKEYRKEKNSINDSVRMTIDYCRKNGIMTDYLTDNESEVINMFGFEWNEEDERKALIELGEERGETRGTITSIQNLMKTCTGLPRKLWKLLALSSHSTNSIWLCFN